jgi:hypothetical protein
MSTVTRPLATLIAIAGLLASAAPASAGTAVGNPGDPPAKTKSICPMPDVCILYNGHAGLGLNVPDVTVIPT